MSDERTIDPLECRTYDPSVAKWTPVSDAAKALGAREGRIHGWIYKGKIEGTKKEGGKVLIPACEMTRLLELHKAGTLDAVMWKQAQREGARRGRDKSVVGGNKSAGKRRAEAVQKALRKASERVDKALEKARPFADQSASEPTAADAGSKPQIAAALAAAVHQQADEAPAETITMTKDQLTTLISRVIWLQEEAQRVGLRVYLT